VPGVVPGGGGGVVGRRENVDNEAEVYHGPEKFVRAFG
jgi:hypothetical protein